MHDVDFSRSDLLQLLSRVTIDQAEKIGMHLGVPDNIIQSLRARVCEPDLLAVKIIQKWEENYEGSGEEAVEELACALRRTGLGAIAARLIPGMQILWGRRISCQISDII